MRGAKPIARTNLCILTESGYERFAQVHADVDATLFVSLPFYRARNVDKICGDGTFVTSIEGLRMLNAFSYGEGGRAITLVYARPPRRCLQTRLR